MKKGIIGLLVSFILFSSIVSAAGVTYGAQITRIQTFPGEQVQADIAQAKANIGAQNDEALTKLSDLTDQAAQLKLALDKLSTDANNARTESNVQQSNILNTLSNIKSQLDDLKDVKNLPTQLPPLLEQPRQIITPTILLGLAITNILLLIIVIALILFVRRDHEASHAMTPHNHPELHDYIKQHITKGVHINTIRKQLISHDWDPAEVDQAIQEVRES